MMKKLFKREPELNKEMRTMDLPSKSLREVEKGDDAKRVKKRLKQKKMERS